MAVVDIFIEVDMAVKCTKQTTYNCSLFSD